MVINLLGGRLLCPLSKVIASLRATSEDEVAALPGEPVPSDAELLANRLRFRGSERR